MCFAFTITSTHILKMIAAPGIAGLRNRPKENGRCVFSERENQLYQTKPSPKEWAG